MNLAGTDQPWDRSPEIVLDYLASRIIEGGEDVPACIQVAVCDRLLLRQAGSDADGWEQWFHLYDEFSPYPADSSFRELLDEEYVRR